MDDENNCADIGVTGTVRDKGNDEPIPNVMVEVRRTDNDDDEFQGPFSARTDQNGRYNIYIGPKDDVGHIELKALVVGDASVISEDEPEWETSSDCKDDDEIQVMEIHWGRKD